MAELEAIRTETVKKEKEEKNKALEKERLKAIEYKDYVVPEGVFVPVSSLPQREPQKGAQTA